MSVLRKKNITAKLAISQMDRQKYLNMHEDKQEVMVKDDEMDAI